jgi:hypothetical protein
MIVVPVPVNVKPPAPENTPERVAEAEVGLWITPPALVMLKAVFELSPLNSTSVPPDKTGLAPMELSPTLVPLEIVETVDPPDDESEVLPELQTLHAVISRFQIPDPDAVSLKTKV